MAGGGFAETRSAGPSATPGSSRGDPERACLGTKGERQIWQACKLAGCWSGGVHFAALSSSTPRTREASSGGCSPPTRAPNSPSLWPPRFPRRSPGDVPLHAHAPLGTRAAAGVAKRRAAGRARCGPAAAPGPRGRSELGFSQSDLRKVGERSYSLGRVSDPCKGAATAFRLWVA